jgi:hypothetical protein
MIFLAVVAAIEMRSAVVPLASAVPVHAPLVRGAPPVWDLEEAVVWDLVAVAGVGGSWKEFIGALR